MKKFLALILALLMALSLVACGASTGNSAAPKDKAAAGGLMATTETADMEIGFDAAASDNGVFEEYAYQSAPAEPYSYEEEQVIVEKPKDAKMVYSAHIELQTLSFEEADRQIEALVKESGGYFEHRSISNRSSGYRYGDYTVRVPAEQYESFCVGVGELCHLTYKSEDAQNITESYYDTESRLQTARTKLERLQELLRRAESMEDIITIESAISETEWEIENLSGTLRTYDSMVDYATVYLTLSEVYQLSDQIQAPVTFGQRLGESFLSGLRAVGRAAQNFFVWLAYSWIWLVVIAVAAVLVVRFLRRRKGGKPCKLWGRKKNHNEPDTEKKED